MQNTTPQSQNQFNDEKEHYKSLIDLFKFSISIITTVIAVIGLGIGFFTYSNGKEMREDLEKQKSDMKESVNAIKTDLKEQKLELKERGDSMTADLKRQEVVMKQDVAEIKAFTRDEVRITKERAISQIANIKSIATEEARNRIDRIFNDKNLDKFIEDVAKERMEPKIKSMVDDKMAQLEKINKARLNDAIDYLSSYEQGKMDAGLSYILLSREQKFSEEQLSKILKFIEMRYDGEREKAITLVNLVFEKSSPTIDQFFRHYALQNDTTTEVQGMGSLKGEAFRYFTLPAKSQNESFYRQILDKTKFKTMTYIHLIYEAIRKNNKLIGILLLDSEVMFDMATKDIDLKTFEDYKKSIKEFWRRQIKNDDYNNTYFFKVKKQ